ncbi:MAG TPA: AMP-binding protein, partial [Candidatus Dormibacteraeota bacterium]
MPVLDLDPETIDARTTVGVLFRQAARYGDRAMLHHLVGDAWQVETWNDMQRDVLAVASALLDAGIQRGDTVVLISENRLEWLYCDFAIQSVGAVTIPIYPNSPPDIAQKIADDSAATLAIASSPAMATKLKLTGSLKTVALIEKEIVEWVRRGPTRVADVQARLSHVKPDDLCTIVYTSGTTGDPKGVELAHRNLVDMSRAVVQVHPITDADSSLSFLPYAHVFERINDIFLGIL